MIELFDQKFLVQDGAPSRALEDNASQRAATLCARVLAAHDSSREPGRLAIKFDALASHDITYVGIIQAVRASGLKEFPLPYILTNCHNSLCAVGGTINEDDHVFGLMAAKKYGGIFVPANLAVIHQYIREMMARCGGMILGSDSHTRYGPFGVMGVGEGGPELARQLLGETWNIPVPETALVWMEGSPRPGIGPMDAALAIISSVFKNEFVKNRVMEFMGPGISSLDMDFRSGIDVMMTETACLSTIWRTDDTVRDWLAQHGREGDYKKMDLEGPALYDRMIKVDLSAIEPMIALPFHPSNAYPIKEFTARAKELLAGVQAEAEKLFGAAGKSLNLESKIKAGGVSADQGVIAGCAGGLYNNIAYAAAILELGAEKSPGFSFSLYPASVPVASALVKNGFTEKLMNQGAVFKPAFCGPCFGAGDTPANGALSIRATTRNFPNREGSKPKEGQLACVALMDARSIAATAARGGVITPATELDWKNPGLQVNLEYKFNPSAYEHKVYNGFGKPEEDVELVLGPNISDWPAFEPLPEHLILEVASVILDPVTTTDELIPSGETSSLRSNPQKLAEHTLERKDPGYVARAKAVRSLEEKRLANPEDPEVLAKMREIIGYCKTQPIAEQMLDNGEPMSKWIGLGSLIYANKPGDGSAREQAASCQRVLGGWANMAAAWATKRYHSNLINWGILPFIVPENIGPDLKPGDYFVIPHVRSYIYDGDPMILGALVHMNEDKDKIWSEQISVSVQGLTKEDREILMAGSLINFNANKGNEEVDGIIQVRPEL